MRAYADEIAQRVQEVLGARLTHETLPSPGAGVRAPRGGDLPAAGSPRFQLDLDTGPRMDHHVAYAPEDDPRFRFTIDVDMARSTAVPLIGPPAADVFPELPRGLVATAVLEGLDWWTTHSGAPVQTLLSACRSWAWATGGRWRSKGESARWAAARLPDPRPVEAALWVRAGRAVDPPGRDDVEVVVAAAREALQRLAVRW